MRERLVADFDFVLVCIEKSHAVGLDQDQRIIAARELRDSMFPSMTTVVDFSKEAETRFHATPARLFVVNRSKIVYQGGVGLADLGLGEDEIYQKLALCR